MTEKEIKGLAREYINSCTKRAGFAIKMDSLAIMIGVQSNGLIVKEHR